MTSMPETTFQNLRTNIAVLDLDGNPLDCSCKMIWYRSWLQENEYQQPGPRCGNGKMLRDLPMSRSDCEGFERNNQLRLPLINEHGDMFGRQVPDGNLCENDHFEELQNGLPPSPEESEYFDQAVDYPNNDTNPDQPPPPSLPQNIIPNQGKTFNNSNTLLNLNNRPVHAQQNPFTIFGIPIPSFGQLWGQGRHANGRSSSYGSRGRGRVQLYNNDDPELLKLLNKNDVRPENSPLDHRPIFQTPFTEPQEVQRGGFVPIVPGTMGGFQPMNSNESYFRNETSAEKEVVEEGNKWPDRFQEVIPLVHTESSRIKFNGITPPKDEVKEDDKPDQTEAPFISRPEQPEEEDLRTPPESVFTNSKYEESDLNPKPDEIVEDSGPEIDVLPPSSTSSQPNHGDIKPSWADSFGKPNELLSALVAPGAQQGIYKIPPGRSTITKVFTPSSSAPSSTLSSPFAEEFQRPAYESHTHQDNAIESNDFVPTHVLSQFENPNKNKDLDWYYKSYNKTETKQDNRNIYPKTTTSSAVGLSCISSLYMILTISSCLFNKLSL